MKLPEIKDPKIIAVKGGFYFFGDLIESPQPGYIALKNLAMFGDYEGGKGMPGVARGARGATVILDRFAEDEIGIFLETNCVGIFTSLNLYEQEYATLR
jgi:hypothetical protein